jgi:FkbM family methyltransferase
MSSPIYRIRRYGRETGAHWRETNGIAGFLALMQVRLSQSKIGPLVCPRPTTRKVHLKSFGGPVWLRSHSSDISIVNEQLFYPGYGPLLEHTGEATTIVDLGANTGIVARWLLHHHPRARIVCVEPAEENVAMLEINLGPVADRAVVVARCIGGVERRVKVATNNGSWAYVMEDTASEAEANSTVVTMSGIIEEHDLGRVGLLKSNIEGAEWEVLEHGADWIGLVDAMVIEFHDGRMDDAAEHLGTDWTVLHRVPNPHYNCETVAMVRS